PGTRPLALTLGQVTVLVDQQIEMGAFFLGEFQEDLFALRILEALAVPFEEVVRAALALDADEEGLLIVDALAQFRRALVEQAIGRALEEQEGRPRFELWIGR